MKTCTRNLCIVIVLALLLAVTVGCLYAAGLIVVDSYYSTADMAMAMTGVAVLLGMLLTNIIGCHSKALKEAFCCCGSAAVIGAAALVVTAICSALTGYCCSGPLPYILLALCVFFLVLAVGAVCCFLMAYHQCGAKPCGGCRPHEACLYSAPIQPYEQEDRRYVNDPSQTGINRKPY